MTMLAFLVGAPPGLFIDGRDAHIDGARSGPRELQQHVAIAVDRMKGNRVAVENDEVPRIQGRPRPDSGVSGPDVAPARYAGNWVKALPPLAANGGGRR